MKKVFIFLILVVLLLFLYGEKRNFYKLGDNKYITVWKTFNNVCYIIPYKYYGIVHPSDNYVKTTNDNYLVIFWSSNYPKNFIFWENKQDEPFEIFNKKKEELLILNYVSTQDSLHRILYKPNSKLVTDVKDEVEMLNIDTKENYTTDKAWRKL